MLHLLTPHVRLTSVLEITIERLRQWKATAVLLDVDCTLTRYRWPEVAPEVAAWLNELRQAGIRLCLVSNGLSHRIEPFADRLGLPFVARAMKPLPGGVRLAMEKLGASPAESVMVGDQIFADVMAGRWAGVRSVLVEPLHPEEEPWFTRLKRVPERLWLDRRV